MTINTMIHELYENTVDDLVTKFISTTKEDDWISFTSWELIKILHLNRLNFLNDMKSNVFMETQYSSESFSSSYSEMFMDQSMCNTLILVLNKKLGATLDTFVRWLINDILNSWCSPSEDCNRSTVDLIMFLKALGLSEVFKNIIWSSVTGFIEMTTQSRCRGDFLNSHLSSLKEWVEGVLFDCVKILFDLNEENPLFYEVGLHIFVMRYYVS
jgi:hypothetical protein